MTATVTWFQRRVECWDGCPWQGQQIEQVLHLAQVAHPGVSWEYYWHRLLTHAERAFVQTHYPMVWDAVVAARTHPMSLEVRTNILAKRRRLDW